MSISSDFLFSGAMSLGGWWWIFGRRKEGSFTSHHITFSGHTALLSDRWFLWARGRAAGTADRQRTDHFLLLAPLFGICQLTANASIVFFQRGIPVSSSTNHCPSCTVLLLGKLTSYLVLYPVAGSSQSGVGQRRPNLALTFVTPYVRLSNS